MFPINGAAIPARITFPRPSQPTATGMTLPQSAHGGSLEHQRGEERFASGSDWRLQVRFARYTMGVEYCHYLIPRPNSFRPSAEQLAGLVEAWAKDHWIAAPGADALKKMALIDEMPYEEAAEIWAHIRLSPGFA